MTENRMRNTAIELARLRSKRCRIEGEATAKAPKLGGVPGNTVGDKVGTAVVEIAAIDERIKELEAERAEGFRRLNREVFEENCYYLKYCLRYSWRRISVVTMHRADMEEAVRKRVRRYFRGYEW